MNKSPVALLLLAVAVCCSCHDVADRKSVRSASDVSARTNPVAAFADAPPHDSQTSETAVRHAFTARKKGGGHKNNKMEMMHMGLSYVKMILSTLMSVISHIFAFKSTTLTLIGVLIQIAQFVMALKKHKESLPPPTYKIVETPWHTQAPLENYGVHSGYGGYGGYASAKTGNVSPYGQRKRR